MIGHNSFGTHMELVEVPIENLEYFGQENKKYILCQVHLDYLAEINTRRFLLYDHEPDFLEKVCKIDEYYKEKQFTQPME
jgi:hypothetical protein